MSSYKKNKMFITKKELNLENIKKENSKSPLTKENLIIQLAIKYDLPKKCIENIIKDFFLIISKDSKKYSHISFYGFGTFKEKKIKSKRIKIPGKKDTIKTKEKNYLVFKSSFEI